MSILQLGKLLGRKLFWQCVTLCLRWLPAATGAPAGPMDCLGNTGATPQAPVSLLCQVPLLLMDGSGQAVSAFSQLALSSRVGSGVQV